MGYVYILTNASWVRTLYIGVTADLPRRLAEHRSGLVDGFSSKYRCRRLVYFEGFGDIRDAITREKQLKGWRRARKLELIEAFNPSWHDLSNLSR
jgi:putative endonuclease